MERTTAVRKAQGSLFEFWQLALPSDELIGPGPSPRIRADA